MDPTSPSYTVLRIKRKATESPLSSLVIQDEPESRTKKRRDVSARARGIFRLAETVPETWQGEGAEAASLTERIKGLMEADQPQTKEEYEKPLDPVPPPPPPLPQYQYRVVPPTSPQTRAMLPPRVLTIAETEKAAHALVFVDALAVGSPAAETSSHGSASKRNGNGAGGVPPCGKQDGEEMDAFQSMLSEYLDLERSARAKPVPLPHLSARRADLTAETGQYVYDLYFRDLRPSLSSTPLGLGAGDGVTIGALLGYEDLSPSSTPDASEPEDEADEDSNDEDYYRNDYPEDEDADEDMRGYRDAFSDEDEEAGYGDDGDARGEWDYR